MVSNSLCTPEIKVLGYCLSHAYSTEIEGQIFHQNTAVCASLSTIQRNPCIWFNVIKLKAFFQWSLQHITLPFTRSEKPRQHSYFHLEPTSKSLSCFEISSSSPFSSHQFPKYYHVMRGDMLWKKDKIPSCTTHIREYWNTKFSFIPSLIPQLLPSKI